MLVLSLKGYAVLRNRNYRLFWLGQLLPASWNPSVSALL